MNDNESNKQVVHYNVEDLRKIVAWWDSIDSPGRVPNVTLESTYVGMGTMVKAFVRTDINEGVWKDFTDMDNW
jgi:hypothetical protein